LSELGRLRGRRGKRNRMKRGREGLREEEERLD
jgi:hypothetical protein